MTEQSNQQFDQWAVVEVMGHQRYAGRVTEQSIGGGSFVRVDVPAVKGRQAFTKLFGHGSIYCITPCTEEAAIKAACSTFQDPVSAIGIPVKSDHSDEDIYSF